MVHNDFKKILDFFTAATGMLDLIFLSNDLEATSCKLGGNQMNTLTNNYIFF